MFEKGGSPPLRDLAAFDSLYLLLCAYVLHHSKYFSKEKLVFQNLFFMHHDFKTHFEKLLFSREKEF